MMVVSPSMLLRLLLARAYLYYTGYYGEEHPACSKAEATAAINDVVENGGYELEENYKDFWMPSSDITAESKTVTGDVTKYTWQTTYAGKWYDGKTWKSGQGNFLRRSS